MRTHKSDVRIQREVLDELAWDTRVECTEIGVEVHDSVVTLTGAVPTWAKKLAAEEAAHRVGGVLDVANDLVVKLPDRDEHDDTEIAAAIRQALIWDVYVPDEQIRTTVSKGFVRLDGEVELASQRDDAARALRYITGVRGLDNRIIVKPPLVAKETLHGAIRDALRRHADGESMRIELEIDRGHVIIHGEVDSWADRVQVLEAARGTRGVDHVIDRLHVRLPVVR